MQNDGVATHTEHTVLSSAAFADFQGEVCRLLAMRTVGAPYASACQQSRLSMHHGPEQRCCVHQDCLRSDGLHAWMRHARGVGLCGLADGQGGVLVGDGLAPADAWEPLVRDLAASWWRHMGVGGPELAPFFVDVPLR